MTKTRIPCSFICVVYGVCVGNIPGDMIKNLKKQNLTIDRKMT